MIEGYDKLLQQFENIADLDWVKAETAGMEIIAEEARALVPVDTGALQDSIRVQVEGEEVQLVAGGEGVDYQAYVEFGTIKMEAQPYMRPAIDSKQGEATKAIAANLNEQIKARV
jgi:HK97 gp10 family phage protein